MVGKFLHPGQRLEFVESELVLAGRPFDEGEVGSLTDFDGTGFRFLADEAMKKIEMSCKVRFPG